MGEFLRYMVFDYDQYYPGGGVSDCSESFSDLDKAIEYAKKQIADYVEIFDRIEGNVVFEK